MASKQNRNENEEHHDANFADMQTSFSINEIGSKIEKEARDYLEETNFDFFLKELTKILICKKNQNLEANFYQGYLS